MSDSPTNDTIIVRRPEDHELRSASDAMRTALLNARTTDEEWSHWGGGWQVGYAGITAWDGDRCVGNAGAFRFDTLVPGGAWLATAGITRVGVIPTHTRRGLLTRMMHQLLTEQRAEGKVLASLRASEAPIYGRFGFGLAGEATEVLVHPSRVRPITGAAAGACRLLAPAEMMAVIPDLYRRLAHRVGVTTRDEWMWRRTLDDVIEGKKAEFVVVHSDTDGGDDGYAIYSLAWNEGDFIEIGGRGTLDELFGTSPAVELALWDHMTSVGLVRSIACANRPVDDVIRLVASDYRGYEVKRRWDEQWLRLLDVGSALQARSYAQGEPVTIAVADALFPANDGMYRISPSGVERTSGPADLVASIEALSATFMGSVTWCDLLAVGRLTSGTVPAAARADTLFRHSPGTWCGTFF